MCSGTIFISPGLTKIMHSMSNPVKITPFPPGHFEVFDLRLNGKVESVQLDQFHCCTKEPKHATYNNIENLGTGKNAEQNHRVSPDINPLSNLIETPCDGLMMQIPFTGLMLTPTLFCGSAVGFALETVKSNIRILFESAVRKRLMAHRRIGCLLSGKASVFLFSLLLFSLFSKHRSS